MRDVADGYVGRYAELNPIMTTFIGLPGWQDELPALTPEWYEAADDLRRATLTALAGVERDAGPAGFADADERRCARLLAERLEAELAVSAAGENLRQVSNIVIAGPHQMVRQVFLMMPAVTADDWAVIARRLGRVPRALAGYRSSLAEGAARGLYAAPRLVETVAGQLAGWQQSGGGRGWFTGFAAGAPAAVPASLRSDLAAASAAADVAVAGLRDWLGSDYLAGTAGTADGVGEERYRVSVRLWNGTDPDLTEAYEWGWSQYREILAEMAAEAGRVLPGSSAREAMGYLDSAGEVVEGVEAVRDRLQQLLEEAMAGLAGTHFDLAEPVRKVEARIAPPGSVAAPFCTPPSRDFSRPGQTWFPTLGKTSFPMWNLYSTWYHEGVPGHHLQYGQWVYLSDRLPAYQTSLGMVSACVEGWALYAERLMDELGFLEPPARGWAIWTRSCGGLSG